MDDKTRWNHKHQTVNLPTHPIKLVQQYVQAGNSKKALDIACGAGRHTHYLAELGFKVDAVDISDFALSQLQKSPLIIPIECDLTMYKIPSNHYDLILNINYLERRLFPEIIAGLKTGGMVLFETFIIAHDSKQIQPINPHYLLQSNELLEVFSPLKQIFYEERSDINMYGDKVKIASYVGIKEA